MGVEGGLQGLLDLAKKVVNYFFLQKCSLKMSDESEDSTELRDILFRALEMNGVVSNVRAQLRSSVYTIIEQERRKLQPLNSGLTHQQQCLVDKTFGPPNRISLALVKDFLKKLKLYYTLNLLESELSLEEIDLESAGRVFLPDFQLPENVYADSKDILKTFDNLPIDINISTDDSTNTSTGCRSAGKGQASPKSSATTRSKKLEIKSLPVLSQLILTKCISRHKSSIEKEFRVNFASFNQKLSQQVRLQQNLQHYSHEYSHHIQSPSISASTTTTTTSTINNVTATKTKTVNLSIPLYNYLHNNLKNFNPTKNLPNLVLEAYIKQILNEKNYSHNQTHILTIQNLSLSYDNLKEISLEILKLITTSCGQVLSADRIFIDPPITDERLLSHTPGAEKNVTETSVTE